MSISKVFGFRKWFFLFKPSDKATDDMTHDLVWLSFLQAHWLATVLVKIILIYGRSGSLSKYAQCDGWGELISRYGQTCFSERFPRQRRINVRGQAINFFEQLKLKKPLCPEVTIAHHFTNRWRLHIFEIRTKVEKSLKEVMNNSF